MIKKIIFAWRKTFSKTRAMSGNYQRYPSQNYDVQVVGANEDGGNVQSEVRTSWNVNVQKEVPIRTRRSPSAPHDNQVNTVFLEPERTIFGFTVGEILYGALLLIVILAVFQFQRKK